jgi:hypothetical protein
LGCGGMAEQGGGCWSTLAAVGGLGSAGEADGPGVAGGVAGRWTGRLVGDWVGGVGVGWEWDRLPQLVL